MDSPTKTLKSAFKPLKKSENKFFVWAITGLAFVLPLFFLSLTSEFYIFNKTILLFIFTAVLMIVWAVKVFFEQKITILQTPLNLPVLGLILAYLLSSLIQAPNKAAALIGPAGIMISLCLLYFFIVNYFRGKKPAIQVMTAFISTSVALSCLTILAYLGILEKIGVKWLTKTWAPTGSPMITAIFMIILLPGTLYWAFKNKDVLQKILLFVAGGLQVLSLVLIVSLFVNKTVSLSYLLPNYGWAIAVEGFKNLRTALLGVGPNNFLAGFNQFRPAGLNNTLSWATKFNSNSNQFFHLLSTVGIFGLVSYFFFVWKSLHRDNFKGSLINKIVYVSLAVSFITQLIFPASLLILFLTFSLAAMLQAGRMPVAVDMGYEHRIKSQGVVWGVAATLLLLALYTCYWSGRVWLADSYFKKSLVAAQENKGGETYNLQIKAVTLNNFSENYRLSYSNTNFALANSLANQENITDQDRQNISQLISQSVREAKAAISLNSQVSSYWVNLANIYRNLINVTEEADQWTVSSYLEAVKRDPTNPLLRIEFGGLFFSLQAFDQAINQFNQAVSLKSDYANGYYNLASAYKAKEDWVNAFQNMQLAMNLIPVDSPDYQKASDELEEIRMNLPSLPETETTGQLNLEEQLTEPEPLPSPNKKVGEIDLPEETGVETEAGEEATTPASPF